MIVSDTVQGLDSTSTAAGQSANLTDWNVALPWIIEAGVKWLPDSDLGTHYEITAGSQVPAHTRATMLLIYNAGGLATNTCHLRIVPFSGSAVNGPSFTNDPTVQAVVRFTYDGTNLIGTVNGTNALTVTPGTGPVADREIQLFTDNALDNDLVVVDYIQVSGSS